MDQLRIKDLEIFAYHGLFPSEKELGQKFIISASLSYDMTKAATDLDLTASVHYGELCQQWTTWFLSLIHISEPTRRTERSRMPSSA